MEFVPGLMGGQQVQAVRENLLSFEQTVRADYDVFIISAILYRACAYGNVGLALTHFKTAFSRKTALLAFNQAFPLDVVALY